ncbi:S-adenosyl-L-methionine-dependent methyltransferase [Nemania serpens]|nr:S-adenosyl-L-methionine-dependent methyltransferase [Nemania serpens]
MAFDPTSRTNRLFWNEYADTIYAEEWVRKVSVQVAECLQSNIDWIEIRKSSSPSASPVKLLDYACGFGAVSTTLFEHADVIRGVDVSDHMVDAYNRLATQLGVSPQRMSAVQGNVLDDEHSSAALDGPDFSDVDAVFMTMALHHIQDPVALLSKLVHRMAPGGVLVLVDWLAGGAPSASSSSHPHAAHSHGHGHGHGQGQGHGHSHAHVHAHAHSTITRGSYSEQELRDIFRAAGCDESSFGLRPHVESSLVPEHSSGVPGGLRKQLFIARARKPGSSP